MSLSGPCNANPIWSYTKKFKSWYKKRMQLVSISTENDSRWISIDWDEFMFCIFLKKNALESNLSCKQCHQKINSINRSFKKGVYRIKHFSKCYPSRILSWINEQLKEFNNAS